MALACLAPKAVFVARIVIVAVAVVVPVVAPVEAMAPAVLASVRILKIDPAPLA